MLHELLHAGPVFWSIMVFFAIFIIGGVSEQKRKRKLQIDLQTALDRKLI